MTNGVFAGFADYGVNVNPLKTRLSFDMTTSSGTHLQVCLQLTLHLTHQVTSLSAAAKPCLFSDCSFLSTRLLQTHITPLLTSPGAAAEPCPTQF